MALTSLVAVLGLGGDADDLSDSGRTITLATAVPAGDSVVAYYGSNAGSTLTATCTDSRGNAYTQNVISQGISNRRLIIFSSISISTPLQIGDTLAVAQTVASTRRGLIVEQWTGLGAFDSSATTHGTSLSVWSTLPTAVRAQPVEVILGALLWTSGTSRLKATAGSGFTNAKTLQVGDTTAWHELSTEYRFVSAVGTEPSTWTTASTTGAAVTATFLATVQSSDWAHGGAWASGIRTFTNRVRDLQVIPGRSDNDDPNLDTGDTP